MNNLKNIFKYHNDSKHGYHGFAPGPGYLDWKSQPDPFRRYEGTDNIPLRHFQENQGPSFSETLRGYSVKVSGMDFDSISQLFYDSLAISAWKSYQGNKWALRVNPSSGNLHPTEAYLISGPLKGLSTLPTISHYSPLKHGLEIRAKFPENIWVKMIEGMPKGSIFIGLSSIYWREAWKYGLRAFRYCHHDLGHALASINLSCACLGWHSILVDNLSANDLKIILGLPQTFNDEIEVPDCLLSITPNIDKSALKLSNQIISNDFVNLTWKGDANILSKSHIAWPGIEDISENSEKPLAEKYSKIDFIPKTLHARFNDDLFPVRKAIHQRRSAVAMDRKTKIDQKIFYAFMTKTLVWTNPVFFRFLPYEPQVHLGIFIHRVEGLSNGLYFLIRNKVHLEELHEKLKPDFLWEIPKTCPKELDLFLLKEGNYQNTAKSICCGQDIAADGCFSLGMITAFERSLRKYGAWFYPRLFWECGVIGQILYLQAEVSGIRSTGIGCFFDDPVHEVFGITDMSYQSLYHFTVGGPIEDTRLTTLPPY